MSESGKARIQNRDLKYRLCVFGGGDELIKRHGYLDIIQERAKSLLALLVFKISLCRAFVSSDAS